MFDFEKLEVYKKAKSFNVGVLNFLKQQKVHKTIDNQLRRASFSILLNIAEGSGRFTKADKKHFYVIARGSVFECAAIYDYLIEVKVIDQASHISQTQQLEEISKMLFAIIRYHS